MERVGRIIAADTPVAVQPGPKTIIHVIPLAPFQLTGYIDDNLRSILLTHLKPMVSSSFTHRPNIDGYITFTNNPVTGYCQLFRTGVVETVHSSLVNEHDDDRSVSSVSVMKKLVDTTGHNLAGLKQLQVPTPLYLAMTFTGVKNARLASDYADHRNTFDRDTLQFPGVVVDSYEGDVAKIVRPILDAVWSAAGLDRCMLYDLHGNMK